MKSDELLRECRGFLDSTGHRGAEEGCPTCDLMKRIDAHLATAGEESAATGSGGRDDGIALLYNISCMDAQTVKDDDWKDQWEELMHAIHRKLLYARYEVNPYSINAQPVNPKKESGHCQPTAPTAAPAPDLVERLRRPVQMRDRADIDAERLEAAAALSGVRVPGMTNDELKEAIQAAWALQNRTAVCLEIYEPTKKHYETLLLEQQRRAMLAAGEGK